MKNNRQVSIFSCPGKMFDLLMYERQHGFLKGCSTINNLIDFVSSIINSLEAGKPVDALYLDFGRAFDSLNHDLLFEKLLKYGVPTRSLTWLASHIKASLTFVS